VVFDYAIMSGTPLGGRCSPYRGMTVTYVSVLNITHPKVIANTKAAEARKPLAPNTSTDHRSGNRTSADAVLSGRHTPMHNGLGRGSGEPKLMARNGTGGPAAQYHTQSNPVSSSVWQKQAVTSVPNNHYTDIEQATHSGTSRGQQTYRPTHPQQAINGAPERGFVTRGRGRGRGGV
jgi:5'-3' exoribonuclease 1